MQRAGTIIVGLVAAVLIPSTKGQAQDSSDMARCAELENAEARLACYDEVAGRSRAAQPEHEPEPETAELETADTPPRREPIPLTEEFGQEQVEGRPDAEPTVVRGRVTGCQKDINDKWYFVFDNGQVWQQRASARLRFPECDFWVTITEDTFGYKMQVEGEGKQIRVGRIR